MTRAELPKQLFMPTALFEGIGSFHAQPEDDQGNIIVPIWGSSEKAMLWLLDGGLELLRKNKGTGHNFSLPNSRIGVSFLAADDSFFWGSKRVLHYEPDQGQLFAPGDRQIAP